MIANNPIMAAAAIPLGVAGLVALFAGYRAKKNWSSVAPFHKLDDDTQTRLLSELEGPMLSEAGLRVETPGEKPEPFRTASVAISNQQTHQQQVSSTVSNTAPGPQPGPQP